MNTNITINKKQRLFVVSCGKTCLACLGFDVCYDRALALALELGRTDMLKGTRRGSKRQYSAYIALVECAEKKHLATGWRSTSELSPQLVGKEGSRVEVETVYGEKRRFIVGKSTGFIPCHLEVSRRNSHGGPGAEHVYKSVRVL